MTRIIISFLILITFASCSSTTLIRVTDPQANIYVDNNLRGKGSVAHTDTKMVGSTTVVKLEKPGCEPAYYSFDRNEEFDPGACAAGLFTLVPFLWIQKYKAERTYEYNCIAKKK